MALFKKQDFSPVMLTPRWFAVKFRPNMLVYCHDHIVSILSSGLLFREDSIEIEQDASSWMIQESFGGGWMTRGEKLVSAVALCAVVAAFPPKTFNRWSVLRCSSYLMIPMAVRTYNRSRCLGTIRELLVTMCDYLAVARRGAACCREYSTLYAKLASVAAVVQSMQALLVRQQSDLANLLSRASSAILGNVPWIRGDVNWEAICDPADNLMKIHHTFLVVQSLFLKHLAMAHYLASANAKKVYLNHNERIYWIHNSVIPFLLTEYRENIEALDRIYRLLKNCAAEDSADVKKLGAALNTVWTYAETHSDIARSCLELRIALNTANGVDRFLDACALNRVDVDLEILDKDVEELVESITKCLSTAHSAQKRVTKLRAQLEPAEPVEQEEVVDELTSVVKIEDKDPEIKDEVFYCDNLDGNDEPLSEMGDVVTGPGEKEKQNSRIVMHELKRKLVKREDLMRERERQALKKTMQTEKVPEFPRQIEVDYFDRKGFIDKILRKKPARKLFLHYKIGKPKRLFRKRGDLKTKTLCPHLEVHDDFYLDINWKTDLTIFKSNRKLSITVWREHENKKCSSREGSWAASIKEDSFRCTKRDLDLSCSSSEEDRDFDRFRRRVPGEKQVLDESLLPIEYKFSTGMAMASVMQVNRIPVMVQEEVFVGDGEVSDDSGNEIDD